MNESKMAVREVWVCSKTILGYRSKSNIKYHIFTLMLELEVVLICDEEDRKGEIDTDIECCFN